jgi:hypothetical protein
MAHKLGDLNIAKNMKPQAIATLGVRLIGLAAVIAGVIGGASILIFQTAVNSAPPVVVTSLHTTSYTIIRHHYGLFLLLCMVSLIVGVVLMCASRIFARIVTYGFPNDVA